MRVIQLIIQQKIVDALASPVRAFTRRHVRDACRVVQGGCCDRNATDGKDDLDKRSGSWAEVTTSNVNLLSNNGVKTETQNFRRVAEIASLTVFIMRGHERRCGLLILRIKRPALAS
jgi:hypothetical protein